jgi:prepilin-type N-terminal cleavage/methylation domain-containing protein
MKKGFTLIEIVMVIVVLSIIGLFTFSFLMSSTRTYQMMKTQGVLYQEASYMLERLTRELRDGTYTPSVSANSITFQRTYNAYAADSRIDGNAYIGFNQDSSNIRRASSGTLPLPVGQYIGGNVTSFSIAPNPDPFTTQENTAFTITIVVEDLNNPDTVNRQKVLLTTTVCPKNYCGGGPITSTCIPNYNGRSFNRDYQEYVQ